MTDEGWLDELTQLVRRHGRLPNRQPAELPLFVQVAQVRAGQRQLSPAGRARFDKLLAPLRPPARPPHGPGPQLSPVLRQRLADLEAFVTKHDRLPSQASPVRAERGLYQAWLELTARVLPADAAAVRDRIVAHLAAAHDDLVQRRLADLEVFVAKHGRMPSRDLPAEKAVWRDLCRLQDATLPPDAAARLEAAQAAGHRARPTIEKLEAFIAGHGRPPLRSEPDEVVLARALQRVRAMKLPGDLKDRRAGILAAVAQWEAEVARRRAAAAADARAARREAALAARTPPEVLLDRFLTERTAPDRRKIWRWGVRKWLTWCAEKGVDPLLAEAADLDAWVQQQHPSVTDGTIAVRLYAVAAWYEYVSTVQVGGKPLLAGRHARGHARRLAAAAQRRRRVEKRTGG